MKQPRNWSALLTCELAEKAQDRMAEQAGLSYHNWEHIEKCVWHAEHTFELPFDAALGKGILTHDVVYDKHPQKELRSAQWLMDNDTASATTFDGVKHIMKTDGHAVTDDNRMILIDLADLMDGPTTATNFFKVFMESQNIYRAPPVDVAKAAITFLTPMRDGFADNRIKDRPVWERMAFMAIRAGLDRTMIMYDQVIEGARRG